MNKLNEIMVSICCITYNHEKNISDAIEGFLSQKVDFSIEILIHDDASTDRTVEIIKEYSEKDSRIIPILRKSNLKSTGKAIFSILYKLAKGKYIAICEGDDYWTDPLKLQKQVDFLESNPDFSICHHNFIKSYDNKELDTIAYNKDEIKLNSDIYDLAMGNFIGNLSSVFRKNLPFPQYLDRASYGDYIVHMHNAKYGKIHYINDCMAVYRIHGNGVSNGASNETRTRNVIDGLQLLISDLSFDEKVRIILRQQLLGYYLDLFGIYFFSEQQVKAVQLFESNIGFFNSNIPFHKDKERYENIYLYVAEYYIKIKDYSKAYNVLLNIKNVPVKLMKQYVESFKQIDRLKESKSYKFGNFFAKKLAKLTRK